MKKLRLHRSPFSPEAINAIAQDTLHSGGFNSAEAAAKDPQIGDNMDDDARRVSHRAAHATELIEPSVGAVMKDGTVYAGPSPDTGKPMYAIPADAPVAMTFNRAAEYAKQLNEQKLLGHNDWRVPTKAELNVLFNNRAAIGGFKVSGSYPADWYWSATPYDKWDAWGQRFSDGGQYDGKHPNSHLSVRLVRTEKGAKP